MVSRPATTRRVNWRSADDVRSIGKELYEEFKRDKVTTLAQAVAYNTVFALPAVLLLMVMAAAVVDRTTSIDVTSHLRQLIQNHAPSSTKELLDNQVDQAIAKVGGGGLSIGILVTAVIALWSGSNAIGSMMDAFNLAYGVEEGRSFVRRKLLTLGLTLLLAVSINVSFALLVFGHRIGAWIADKVGAGSLFNVVWDLARWPIAIIAVGLILALLYYLGPDVEQSFRWLSPGSILATVLWIVVTAGFGLYLRFSNPGSAYGVVGSVLVLLFFLYVTGIIFIVGAELNAILEKRHDPKTIRDIATKPEAKPEARAEARSRERHATS
jgi:membrane protein